VDQAQAHNIVYKRNNMDKFSIIDPNKPDNDIAGGASNTRVILALFSDAHHKLQKRMGQLQSQPERAKESILGCILAGNYRSFDIQRSHLAEVHEQTIGPIQD
jgi:non-canonical poly(A) RNA polymerase PAPD5/7